MPMKWYVVHTYSGHENKAKLSLLDRVRQASLNEKFGDILIPTDTVVELVKGQKRSTTRKFFPGYMFVQMDLDQETFHLVKNTPTMIASVSRAAPDNRAGRAASCARSMASVYSARVRICQPPPISSSSTP